MSKRYIAADLFCGAGGLSIGFNSAGFEISFANDIDEDCMRTYKYNHENTCFVPGPIEQLSVNNIKKKIDLRKGDLDVLIGGPPCQGFSINAPVRSQKDYRNYLFKQYTRLVLEGLRPKVVLMENVPGMLSLDGGRFINEIYNTFGLAGYRMKHMILCAAHYGVPQERWRLFFIGTIIPNRDISFPIPTHWSSLRTNFTGGRELTWLKYSSNNGNGEIPFNIDTLKDSVNIKQSIDDLPRLGLCDGYEITEYDNGPNWPYQRQIRKGSRRLYNHVSGKLSPQNLERLKHIPPGGSWRDIPFELLPLGMKRARRSDHTRRYGRLNPNGLSGTILTKCDPHWGTFFHYDQDRTITVREAARIQSFPDRFRFLGSRVSQYVQVGNAVPPKLAEIIALHIKETILS